VEVKSGGYIKRYTRLKKRRERARRLPPDVIRDEAHLARIRRLPCICRNMPGAQCSDVIQAMHRDEGKGLGMKTSDLETLPGCSACHASWTDNTQGPFKNWPREMKRAWFVAALASLKLSHPHVFVPAEGGIPT
jgi:hypothetical protein